MIAASDDSHEVSAGMQQALNYAETLATTGRNSSGFASTNRGLLADLLFQPLAPAEDQTAAA